MVRPGVAGIYHVGDDRPITLQEFLDRACTRWGARPPVRLPGWMFPPAAGLCEAFATIARRPSPLTRDFIRIGRVSYWGDTARARRELVSTLEHPNLDSGIASLD